jgi:hypothetical protein
VTVLFLYLKPRRFSMTIGKRPQECCAFLSLHTICTSHPLLSCYRIPNHATKPILAATFVMPTPCLLQLRVVGFQTRLLTILLAILVMPSTARRCHIPNQASKLLHILLAMLVMPTACLLQLHMCHCLQAKANRYPPHHHSYCLAYL